MGLSKRITITGVAIHNDLEGRTVADAHPQSAITGLETAITNITNTASAASNTALSANDTATQAASNASSAEAAVTDIQTMIGTDSLQTTAQTLKGGINEVFISANNGKSNIATAIVGKGGTANGSMTFSQLSTAITEIPNVTNSTGNATEADVLAPHTFSNDAGISKTGTMPDNSSVNRYAISYNSVPGTISLKPPTGFYKQDSASSFVMLDDPNFIATNIANGASIFGLTGTNTNLKWQTGTTYSRNMEFFNDGIAGGQRDYYPIEVSGLNFTPKLIIGYRVSNGNPCVAVCTLAPLNSQGLVSVYAGTYQGEIAMPAYVNYGGFKLPTSLTDINIEVYWMAAG
jgi:hypothetical protein